MASNAQLEAMDVETVIAEIKSGRAGYTGVRTGEPFDDNGIRYHQVFEYTNGKLTDAYVSRAGRQI